jgi:hypothetical protein
MTHPRNVGAVRLALYASVILALAACSHSAPSERDAKAAINARIGDCSDFKVTDFSKVNGISVDDNDYNVEVKYTIKFTPDGHLKQALANGNKNLFVLLANVKADCPNISNSMLRTISQTAFGTDDKSYDFGETIAMQKTENGWEATQ